MAPTSFTQSERPVPRRWGAEWRDFVAETGRWDLPRVHRTGAFVANSPWPRKLINMAVARLREVFTPEVTRTVFAAPAGSPTLYSLLMGIAAAPNNELLRIGLDLLRAGRVPHRVAKRLAVEKSHWGARFELAAFAAARWVGIRHRFEPLGDAAGPDLLLTLEQPVFAELKAVDTSTEWRQRQRTYETIILGGADGSGMIPLSSVDLAFTPEFHRLDATHAGRSELSRIGDRLAHSVTAAARVMAGPTMVVDDLVRLTAAPDGRPGRCEPLAPFAVYEAARVIDGVVHDACEQLPHGTPGLVLVEMERCWAHIHELMSRTAAWLEGPIGREYPQVAGVLYTHRPWWTNAPWVMLVPVWRNTAPRWLVRSQRLRDLTMGLAWADICVSEWKRERPRH